VHVCEALPAMKSLSVLPNRSAATVLHLLLLSVGIVWGASTARASEPATDKKTTSSKKVVEEELPSATPKEMAEKVREALGSAVNPNKKLTLVINGRAVATAAPAGQGSTPPRSSRKAEGHGEQHWAYEGEGGPQAWGKLKPEFSLCAIGKRQSPIDITDGNTLRGPAEPIQFNYQPSEGSVVNNGHTIQVDVQGDNTITVRNSTYRLVQFHFHTPSEEQINGKRYAMVAHLVHRNDEGQLAVVAVLLEQGEPNELIDKVWTYMPLDTSDRVRMPPGLLNMNELLPADQRYYQFMGSLTTPPCTEGVLWMVIKEPVPISKAQFRLFTQLYANNARPVQGLNGRPVREAQ